MSGQGQGQGQGGTFGQSQGFNPQSLRGVPGFNNAMQRFGQPLPMMPTTAMPPGMGGGQMPTLGAPPSPDYLAQHMAQRNNITNGYVDPGAKPTPQQLAAHMAANNAYTNSYGTPGQVPLPPWLLPR